MSKKEFARVLRKESTMVERDVWKLLRNRQFLNLKFRRQHIVEGYIVDFYCHEHTLAIELDGKVHEKQKDYDELRQGILESKGIMVIHIKNEEFQKDEGILFEKIKCAITPVLALTPNSKELL